MLLNKRWKERGRGGGTLPNNSKGQVCQIPQCVYDWIDNYTKTRPRWHKK
jgi:hypothetical protein